MKKIIAFICVLLFASSVFVGWRVSTRMQDVAEQWYVPTEQAEPFSVLLLGVDALQGGRSDTMIVLTVNQQSGVKMVSIPRDTYVAIERLQTHDKINHAFAFGGVELARETVSDLLHIPIDYVAAVQMEAFAELIDLVGPVTVQNEFAFTYDGQAFAQGAVTLNGEQALKYVRMRYDDPSGDFGRQQRQRAVIEAVIRQAMTWQSITQYEQVLQLMSQHVQMNLTWGELLAIAQHYRASFREVEQLYLTGGEGMRLHDIYYYNVDEAELMRVQQTLQQHLRK